MCKLLLVECCREIKQKWNSQFQMKSPSFMRGLIFNSHVENKCMTAAFHLERMFEPIELS